jgi:transcriptional regulator
MYIPASNRINDTDMLRAFIRQYNFAVLFSTYNGVPYATHLPFLFDEARGLNGTLVAHMARANPHWKMFEGSTTALVVFSGPHSYISPSWYVDQVSVPTWNYTAVHAYGTPHVIHEPDVLRPIVDMLTEVHETAVSSVWDRSLAARDTGAKLEAIVGIEIPVSRLEGKFKLNQNRSVEDRRSVISALEDSSDQGQREMAAMMRGTLEEK